MTSNHKPTRRDHRRRAVEVPQTGESWLELDPFDPYLAVEVAPPSDFQSAGTGAVVLRPWLTPSAADLLNRLPTQLALAAAGVRCGDRWLMSASNARRPETPGASPHRRLIDLVDSGARLAWRRRTVELSDVDPNAALPRLVPKRPGRAASPAPDELRRTVVGIASQGGPVSRTALEAALLLCNDWLDEAHAASQSIEHQGMHHTGDYCHAIVHRREPDYGNSKYWFRSVGTHPVFQELAVCAASILEEVDDSDSQRRIESVLRTGQWDPFAFVDLCEAAARDESSPLAIAARSIQDAEMQLLVGWLWDEAT